MRPSIATVLEHLKHPHLPLNPELWQRFAADFEHLLIELDHHLSHPEPAYPSAPAPEPDPAFHTPTQGDLEGGGADYHSGE